MERSLTLQLISVSQIRGIVIGKRTLGKKVDNNRIGGF